MKKVTTRNLVVISDGTPHYHTIEKGDLQIKYGRVYSDDICIKFNTEGELIFKCKTVNYPMTELPDIISSLKGVFTSSTKRIQVIVNSDPKVKSKTKSVLLRESGDFYISVSKKAYPKSDYSLLDKVVPLHVVEYKEKRATYSYRTYTKLHLNGKNLDINKGTEVETLIDFLETLNSLGNEYSKIKK